MKIIGRAWKPSTSMPGSALIEGENGPWMTLADSCEDRSASQASAASISAATTSRSSIASSAPNCAGEASTGTMPGLYTCAKMRPTVRPSRRARKPCESTWAKCGLKRLAKDDQRSASSGAEKPSMPL